MYEMNKKVGLILKILALVIGGAGGMLLYPVCDKLLELANGNMIHMQCYYMEKTGGILLLCMFFLTIEKLIFDSDAKIMPCLLGILLILITIKSPLFDGPCINVSMACHKTAICFRISGVLYILSECIKKRMKVDFND